MGLKTLHTAVLWGGRRAPFSAIAHDVLVGTSATTIVSVTPTEAAGAIVYVYYRCYGSPILTASLAYNDGSGAQTMSLVDVGTRVYDSTTLVPQFIYATTAGAITVTATASANDASNGVYMSALIMGVA